MLENNHEVRNEKPRSEGDDHLRGGRQNNHECGNYTAHSELKASCSRYDKGMELYKSARVSIGFNGLFKVSGFLLDTEKMQFECPDYKTREQTCKHIFPEMLFTKNRGKQTVEHLDGRSHDSNGNSAKSEPKHTSNKAQIDILMSSITFLFFLTTPPLYNLCSQITLVGAFYPATGSLPPNSLIAGFGT